MGLARTNRLKHYRDFKKVYRQGIRRSKSHLALCALSPSEEPSARVVAPKFGISISQKVSKKAVVRNRIKRQIRAALRELLPQIPPGWQIIIVVRPSAIECKYEHFLRELKQLLKKAKIINGY